MKIRPEVFPFLTGTFLLSGALTGCLWIAGVGLMYSTGAGFLLAVLIGGYLLYFFRDPHRECTAGSSTVVAPADGKIASISRFSSGEFGRIASFCGLEGEELACFTQGEGVVRISIFLSLFDVHVNRAPISGTSRFLGYFRGRHLFTFEEKSSDVNQHNSILMKNQATCCLINQIVGPVCRRVVYWHDHAKWVNLAVGDRIGMMKFGSRLDLYFPVDQITVNVKLGDTVRAGITPLANIN